MWAAGLIIVAIPMYVQVERRPAVVSGNSLSAVARFAPVFPRFGFRGLGAAGSVLSASQISIAQMVANAAAQYGVPANLALGIASHESGFNANATNVNTNGTIDYGVMQLNTTTVQTLGVADPLDPQQNIDAGVGLLAKYLTQYNGNDELALQAYASGPGTVGNPPTSSTSSFIDYVTGYSIPAGVDVSSDASALDLSSDDSDSTALFDPSAFLSSVESAVGSVDPTILAIGGVLLLGLVWAVGRK
jgi:Transglycosylase SLT domain